MRVSPLQRKCALIEYVCRRETWPDDSPAWPAKTTGCVTLLDISRTSFNAWIEGRTAKPRDSVLEKADRTLKQFLTDRGRSGADDTRNLLSNQVGVMELGLFLGIKRRDCRKAIDNAIGKVAPTFSIFSLSDNDMQNLRRNFEGLSFIYRVETTEAALAAKDGRACVLRIPISVRYPIESHKVMAKGMRRLRCRLQVFAYNSTIKNHEYDGYVTKRDGGGRHHHWFFQSRIDEEADVIYMITHSPRRERPDDQNSRRYTLGMMHSRTQDDTPLAAIWPVVMTPLTDEEMQTYAPNDDHEDEETLIMRMGPALLDQSEVPNFVLEKIREAEDLVNVFTLPKLP